MEKIIKKSLRTVLLLCLMSSTILYSQDITVNAGKPQIINWEVTHTAQLEGSVSPSKIKVEWTCPQNPQVTFKDASNPVTEVTFPRPGYYLLILSGKVKGRVSPSSSVIVNVFRPNSCKERLSDLIGLMTVDEKIKQLTNQSDAIPRLGVPRYNYWSEALHGVLISGATSFPQAVALGATWDPELVYRVATAISDEARVFNVVEGKGLTYWSPTINIARDPRWGRNEESYSEDPYLLSRMGVAFVQGMQGNDPYYLKTVSTPKHFMANNEEERRHTGSSDVDMRSMFEYYLPAFHQAVVEGRAYSIMGAYNELNHVPCNANMFLLTDLLRRTWGFEGYVVTDCGAINDMLYGHHFFETGAEAVARSIRAGCDMSCGQEYSEYLYEALDLGLLEEKDLDSALTRVLSARFRLGEFDPPENVPYSSIPIEKLDCKEHRALALEAAQKAIVLLKNDGILPLDKNKIKTIAVIGPNAAEAQLGIYSGFPNFRVSPLEGIKDKAAKQGIKVEYAKGCDIGGGLLSVIEPQYFTKVAGTNKTGMKGEYFDNMELSGKPVLTRIDSTIDFSFGTNSPAPGLPKDQFSIRWTGKIIPPDTIYHLGTSCDDGSRLYLDGKLLIDDWNDHGEKPIGAKVKLIPGQEYVVVVEYYDNTLGATARLTWDLNQIDFSSAKKVAANNDVVILMLGISPGLSQEEFDRKEIELPQVQRDLINEVASVNPNIVIVLINGGPIALAGCENKAMAIVEAWYGGEYGGKAIADVLFGDVNPGGKLPETFYASTQQLPPMSDYDLINHPRTYMYLNQPVLFPFGHGLSYTQFEYGNLKLNSDVIKTNGVVEIQATVRNTGKMKGDEVVQIYAHYIDATMTVPINQLKRFQRITLNPGESKILTFKIPASEFSFYDIGTNDLKIAKGKWELQVGSSSKDIRLKKTFIIE
ncbi:MAG TPA: glycoside hydrolase family 3 C-terminal domain-containing protein [Candidatus Marinimicrobia bacterium]|nr:glycoside hydrolase family 3 C-terminal domain-containing protein [Candidatus Neomarinimicrobiota bacterium]HRS52606.1 glycoside hydrolase family 3 C-terminal domain-containing protein [Candidatus Neomarinimicrobiota bacterium]